MRDGRVRIGEEIKNQEPKHFLVAIAEIHVYMLKLVWRFTYKAEA